LQQTGAAVPGLADPSHHPQGLSQSGAARRTRLLLKARVRLLTMSRALLLLVLVSLGACDGTVNPPALPAEDAAEQSSPLPQSFSSALSDQAVAQQHDLLSLTLVVHPDYEDPIYCMCKEARNGGS
jgi:hypothetical protein